MNNEQEYCYMRLPCGICRLTMTTCPKLNQFAYITTYTGAAASCEANTKEEEEANECCDEGWEFPEEEDEE